MENIRRKVLVVSYVWPPMEGVGLLRALKFSKYLPENGWEPLILTIRPAIPQIQDLAGVRVFRTEYRDIMEELKGVFGRKISLGQGAAFSREPRKSENKANKITSLIREMVLMPDDQIGWYKFAVKEGEKIIKDEGIDAIISTSPPETAHLVARRLKRLFDIPWIADLRDLWAEDHFRSRPLIKTLALQRMERSVLNDADKVVTVSEPWARALRSSLKAYPGKIEVIENGFDEEDFSDFAYGRNHKFTISYTGKLHSDRQPVGTFFKVLRDLVREGRIDKNKIEVRFYVMGYDRPDISGMALSYGLDGVVVELDKVDYASSLRIQRTSDALLFVQWQGKGGEGWYSAKIYDYIGSRRPILALTPRSGIVADIIARTSSGIVADDESNIRKALLCLYDEYMKNGYVSYSGNETEIAKNTRKSRTQRLAALLDEITDRRTSDIPVERQA